MLFQTYATDRFNPTPAESVIMWRLMRADRAMSGAFAVSAGYSVGGQREWAAAALDAAQAVAREARYLLDDLRGLRQDEALDAGDGDHVLQVAATLRRQVQDLRSRAAKIATAHR